MTKRKKMAGKDDEQHVRGKKGPPSATENEKKRTRDKKHEPDTSRGVPRISKHDAGGGGDNWGGDLH
jgi:hypothetical protein